MKVIIITNFGEFIDAVNFNTDLEKWALNWLIESGKDIEIDFHEGGCISRLDDSIMISADNGIIHLDTIVKNIIN